MEVHSELEDHPKPLSGWVCVGIGVGFVALICGLLGAVLLLSG
jgi:hypothetical protein